MASGQGRFFGRALATSFAAALVVASCGGTSSKVGPTSGIDSGGPGGSYGDSPSFVSPPPGDDSSVGSFGDGSGGGLADSSRFVPPDGGGLVGCQLYSKLCGGTCTPITTDPNNCGDCGKVCTNAQICSGGTCVPASKGCIPAPQGGDPALKVCGRSCVDSLNDSSNCGSPTGTGACGHKCAATEGCVNGACVPKLPLNPTTPECGKECYRDLAKTTFRWALCACGNVNLTQQLFTDAYDSTKGPYPPAPLQVGGGVGVNGDFTGGGGQVTIGGALWCAGPGGVTTASATTVSQEVHVANALNGRGPTTLRDNAWVGGNVSGAVAITKTLYASPNATVAGSVTSAMTVRQPVMVAPPCDCSDTALLGKTIDTIVAEHATNNDNAFVGLNAGALATPSATSIRLDLPCGRYYLTGINQPGTSVTIFAHGQTSLFIQGDVVGATVSFVLDPTAEFDTFITGTIKTSGQFIVGSPNYPALSRTYIGGSAPLDLLGEAGRTAGNLYMGKTPLNVSSHLVLYGGLIVNSLANQENIEIHYDRAVLDVPACAPPPPMCGTCKDCGNQACINGSCNTGCMTSDQCCAPLLCVQGTCVAVGPK
ncbi:MAG: hypothetical protein M3O36_15485 [Myxococcota bacterium]|nr:hypothetical protein [Myxococcota bacterium]